MSNQGFERLNVNNNRTFLRTKVGDKYVLESLQANNALVGGEPSGHIILRDYMNSGDGILPPYVLLRQFNKAIIGI